jgi:hypothetical protein
MLGDDRRRGLDARIGIGDIEAGIEVEADDRVTGSCETIDQGGTDATRRSGDDDDSCLHRSFTSRTVHQAIPPPQRTIDVGMLSHAGPRASTY